MTKMILIALYSILASATASAQVDFNTSLISSFSSSCFKVEIENNRAFVTVGEYLELYDISSIESPVMISRFKCRKRVSTMEVEDNIVYIGCIDNTISVIDISNQSNPIEMGFLQSSQFAYRFKVAHPYLYSFTLDTLTIYDISNPTEFIVVGDLPLQYILSVKVIGNTIFSITRNNNYTEYYFRIFDASNPETVVELGSCQISCVFGVCIAIEGNYAYLACANEVKIVDISNYSFPQHVSSIAISGNVNDLDIYGSLLHVVQENRGLRLFDVSDILDPIELGCYDTGYFAMESTSNGSNTLLAHLCNGLLSINTDNPNSPFLIGNFGPQHGARNVALHDSMLFLADGIGVTSWNINTITDPFVIDQYRISQNDISGAGFVAIADNKAYCTSSRPINDGITILDISNPNDMDFIGRFDTPGSASEYVIRDSLAFVADGTSGLRIYDISNPYAVNEIGYSTAVSNATGIFLDGSIAYVADRMVGLRLFDVSNPRTPFHVGFYDSPGGAKDVAVVGSTAFLADRLSGMRIVDVSDSSYPFEIGSYVTSGSVSDVSIVDDLAFVADYLGCLRVLDISDFSEITEIGYYNTACEANSVMAVGDTAYVADIHGGLYVIEYTGGQGHPLAPIQDLQADLVDGQLSLSWTPPSTDILGQSPVLIEHYKLHASSNPLFVPGPETLVTTTTEPACVVPGPSTHARLFFRVITVGEGPHGEVVTERSRPYLHEIGGEVMDSKLMEMR